MVLLLFLTIYSATVRMDAFKGVELIDRLPSCCSIVAVGDAAPPPPELHAARLAFELLVSLLKLPFSTGLPYNEHEKHHVYRKDKEEYLLLLSFPSYCCSCW